MAIGKLPFASSSSGASCTIEYDTLTLAVISITVTNAKGTEVVSIKHPVAGRLTIPMSKDPEVVTSITPGITLVSNRGGLWLPTETEIGWHD